MTDAPPPPPRERAPTLYDAAKYPPAGQAAPFSLLAIVSLIVAVMGSPCLTSQIPGISGNTGVAIGMIIATLLPIAALVRIHFSRVTLRGTGLAVAGLLLALAWWVTGALFAWMFKGFHG